jgi:glycosyltransferase involved in cell wall biosynthesis
MSRLGYNVFIAAPKNKNLMYLSGNRYVRLRRIGNYIMGARRVRNFDGKTICFDRQSERFARRAKIGAMRFPDPIGIDLAVWNPGAISGNRQTMLLSQYNIAPHQKLLLATDPNEKNIRQLILAIQGLERDDFIIALYGKLSNRAARHISRKISRVPRIVYLGVEQDLPSLMRSSFAVVSLSEKNSFYKIAAIAMGRATAWKSCGVPPNILIKTSLADALEKILNMPAKTRANFEKKNLAAARSFGLEKNIAKIKSMIK